MTALAVFAGCTTDAQGEERLEEPTKVRFAWFKGAGDTVQQYVAQDMGYFEDEGLDVEIVYFKSSADAIPSVASGEIEFGMTSNAPILKAIEAGAPIKAIGLTLYKRAGEHTGIAYTALEESGIKKVEDLRGKRIAIPYEGGDCQAYIIGLLREHGIGPEEVTFVTVPWPLQVDALARGEVDVAGIFYTHLLKMELEGINYTIVASSVDLLPHIDVLAIYTSTKYLEEHPDEVRRFLRGFYRGQAYLEKNRDIHKKYLADMGFQPELIEKIDLIRYAGLPPGGRFNETSWKDFMGIMVDAGFLEEEIPTDRIYTEEYLPDPQELDGV